MKKLIVPVLVGLVIGLGGSTAAVVLLGHAPESLEEGLAAAMGEENADSVAADSLAVPGDSVMVSRDSVAEPEAGFETEYAGLTAPVGDTTVVTGQPPIAPATTSVQYVEGAAVAPLEGGLGSDQLAELFGSMQAREAAAVLEHMDDFEVQVILGKLGKRQAAAILGDLTPERAAIISRSIIRSERGAQ